MDAATNIWTKGNYGAPPASQGPMGLFLPYRKLISSAWLPTRWERLKIKGWGFYCLTIPDGFPGVWSLDPQDTQQFIGTSPVYFALAGLTQFSNQPQDGATVELYDSDTQQALVNPFGPPLSMDLVGGSGKRPFWLKDFFFMDPGDTLIAQIANQSTLAQQGQLVAIGFQPLQLGVETKPPAGPEPGVPFFLNPA